MPESPTGGTAAAAETEFPAAQQSRNSLPQYGVTVDGVKRRLPGLHGWLSAAAASPAKYDDTAIASVIRATGSEFTMRTDAHVSPLQIVMNPDGVYDGAGSEAVEQNYPVTEYNPLPYFQDDSESFFRVTLPLAPVRKVQRLRLMLGSQIVYNVPPEWFQVNKQTGEFHIIPAGRSASIASYAGAWQASAAMGSTQRRNVPAVCAFDFIAGLPDGWELSPTNAVLLLRLEEKAALQVLRDISELYDAGLVSASVSSFGNTQQLNYSRFKERKGELRATTEEFEDTYKTKKGAGPIMLSGL